MGGGGPSVPPLKLISFKHRRVSAGEPSEGDTGSSAKIDLNATVIGEIQNIVHPTVIRNQNLFSTQTELAVLVEP